MVTIPDLSAIQQGLPNRKGNSAPIIAVLAAATVAAGGYYLEQRGLPYLGDILAAVTTPEKPSEIAAPTLPVGVTLSPRVAGEQHPPVIQVSSVNAVTELVIPNISQEDSVAILKALWEYPLTPEQLNWISKFHKDGVDNFINTENGDKAELMYIAYLTYGDTMSIVSWDAQLTGDAYAKVLSGGITQDQLNHFSKITTYQIAGLQKYLGMPVTNVYDTVTQKTFAAAIRNDAKVDFAVAMMDEIDAGQKVYDGELRDAQRWLQIEAARIVGSPALESVTPLMHPKSVVSPQFLPVASATAEITSSAGAHADASASVDIETAPIFDHVEMTYEALLTITADMNNLSAIIITPDGTLSDTQINNFAQIEDGKLKAQTNPNVNMEVGTEIVVNVDYNGEQRFYSYIVLKKDGNNYTYSKMERILPEA